MGRGTHQAARAGRARLVVAVLCREAALERVGGLVGGQRRRAGVRCGPVPGVMRRVWGVGVGRGCRVGECGELGRVGCPNFPTFMLAMAVC
jgi:hypothetical protein